MSANHQASSGVIARRLRTAWPFILVITAGLGLRVWVASQGAANLHGDEAIIGLMARHALQGRPPTYVYGATYQGSTDALAGALTLGIFENSVLGLRFSTLLLFAAFWTVQTAFVYRRWGLWPALFSSLLLALPGEVGQFFTTQPQSGFVTMLLCSACAFALSLPREPRRRPYPRLLLLGVFLGIAFWSHFMAVFYIAVLIVLPWLRSSEWAHLYSAIERMSKRASLIPAHGFLPVLSVGLGILGVLAFFCSACQPPSAFDVVVSVARGLLAVSLGVLLIATLWVGHGWKRIIAAGICLAAGFAIGTLPIWRLWLFYGVKPTAGTIPSCPVGALDRAYLTLGELLPNTLGGHSLPRIAHLGLSQALPWAMISLLLSAAFAQQAWANRRPLWAMFALSPLDDEGFKAVLPWAIMILNLMATILGANTQLYCERYLLPVWQTSTIVLGLALSRLGSKSKLLAALVVVFWMLQVPSNGWTNWPSFLKAQKGPWTTATAGELERYLEEHQVRGGYADYWIAYNLDFLSEERLCLAPYNGIDRYPSYSQRVKELSVQAYVFSLGLIPSDRSDIKAVEQALDQRPWGAPTFDQVKASLRGRDVLERKGVAYWDVWLLARPAP